jgi:hypothetical protein
LKNHFFRRRGSRLAARSGIDGNRAHAHADADLRISIVMVTVVLIFTLLTIAASLASWLFGQWLAGRTRISGAALVAGGGGVVLLIGTVGFVVIGATTAWWQRLMPRQDFSPLTTPATAPVSSTETAWLSREPEPRPQAEPDRIDQSGDPVDVPEPSPILEGGPAAEPVRRARFGEPKEQMLAAAERHLARSEYAEAIDVARQYLADHTEDPEMRSMLARSLFAAEHPGVAAAAAPIPAVFGEWQATDCVVSTHSEESSRWFLDNGCGRVVAVLFASCQFTETACLADASASQGWSYERSGILMTAANDKPVQLRLGKDGPLVAPIFTIRDAAGARRQIRYLACEVTAPGVLELLRTSGGDEQRLTAELRVDACYGQVLDWSRSGQRHGSSPDVLLRRGID